MRLLPVVPLSLLLAAGCAARPVAITPAMLESGPRYRLSYVELGSANVDQQVIDQVGVAIEQELAARGMLLAAPWETPTLEIRFGLRGSAVDRWDVTSGNSAFDLSDAGTTIPITYTRAYSDCDGSKESLTHCTALDAPTMIPLTASTIAGGHRRALDVAIREIATSRIVWSRAGWDGGEWTRSDAVHVRPLVQATLTNLPR